ncbi:MAG: helix-turn-helix domain-containing protein [Treponema sp.]|nr:helix-turn-helix domain-containing protein [Treponema sp.]
MKIIDGKTFGAAIREYRKKQNATQVQIAAAANTGARFIGDLENGKPTVQLEKALHVANILGLNIVVLSSEGESK